jgi:hypothetical protein
MTRRDIDPLCSQGGDQPIIEACDPEITLVLIEGYAEIAPVHSLSAERVDVDQPIGDLHIGAANLGKPPALDNLFSAGRVDENWVWFAGPRRARLGSRRGAGLRSSLPPKLLTPSLVA